jgi:mobilization protein NikA
MYEIHINKPQMAKNLKIISGERIDSRPFAALKTTPGFKASGVVVGHKCPDYNARSYAPVGRIGKIQEHLHQKRSDMETVRLRSKKAGRPVIAIKKEVRACIRFSRPEYFIVKENAAKAGLKPSGLIRQLALFANVKPRLTEEERQFVRQLIGMSNNINQIAKSCHQEGALRAVLYFESVRKILDDIIQKLKP